MANRTTPPRRARPAHRHSARRVPAPLTVADLNALAMAYVGRFATSQHRLAAYLQRKLMAAGWADDDVRSADAIAAIAARCAELGFVDDAAFADMRARSMARRGLGRRRVEQQLTQDGIDAPIRSDVLEAGGAAAALASALAFARRRRLGPYDRTPSSDPKIRARAFTAFLRAGHAPTLARAVLDLPDDSAETLDTLDAEALAR